MPNCNYRVDKRGEQELLSEIERLADSYTPEWRFDSANPDIASTIALLFASQAQDNISRLNRRVDKLHTELVNMLGLTLLPAFPSSGVAVLQLIQNTVPGLQLPKGTKLQGQSHDSDSEPIVFETTGDIYLTNAQLTDIVGISGSFGKIIPYLGGPLPPQLLQTNAAQPTLPLPITEEPQEQSIQLFDYTQAGVQRNAALIYHRTVFDTDEASEIQITVGGEAAKAVAESLADTNRYRWSYLSDEGLLPFDRTSAADNVITLRKVHPLNQLDIGGTAYGILLLEALETVKLPIAVNRMGLSSSCQGAQPDFICRNDGDLDKIKFLPFGSTATLMDECYIGHDRIFGQEGATVTLSFNLASYQRLATFTPQQEADNLKVIKRKPRSVQYETVSTSPQEVEFSFFNGIGWRKLVCVQDWTNIFDGSVTGDVNITFRCPEGWRPMVVGAYNGRCLRMRITRADNCYLQPCMHTMPVINGLELTYRYEGDLRQPHLLQSICGTQIVDQTKPILEGRSVNLISPLPYVGNALYLGFNEAMYGGPVSLLFDVIESVNFTSSPILYEYSSPAGWKRLKVVDNTGGLSSAGTVWFMPPSDMAPTMVEGVYRYWIRLVDGDNSYDDPVRYHTSIRAIYTNAAEISNVVVRDEESFFVKVPTPNMQFPLSADNILSAEVYVNEKNRFPQQVMRTMLQEQPENIRCDYNIVGDIRDFFVRWTEVENFDNSTAEDRHYVIDRQSNLILFGDGVNVLIPSIQDSVAFTVRARCCSGAKGNLGKGLVNTMRGSPLYVESIYNPIATYAGSDIESLSSAHRRGADILGSHNRLVSEQDYLRAIFSFSDAVHMARCIVGRDMDGRKDPAAISIAVMMKDYADGPYSFNNVKNRLRTRLLKHCEATVDAGHLFIAEPVYVTVTLSIWVNIPQNHMAFEIQSHLLDKLQSYLDPLQPGGASPSIGVMPTRDRLELLLTNLAGEARVTRFLATVRYSEQGGVQECSLEDLPDNPFFVAVSGDHRIYMELS